MAVSATASTALRTRISRPLVMGILNVTPDSFSDGGLYTDPPAAVSRAEQMAAEGADLIDVGGQSTRPGAAGVSLDEELRRTIPVIRRLAKVVRVPLSIDTSKAEVAQRALDAGASLVNDVTALRGDSAMAPVVARHRASVILMHMQGSPRTMQRAPRYRDVVREIRQFLSRAITQAVEAGIHRTRILVDPGLGFGKTVAHNLLIMQQLDRFGSLGVPVVIGASRKSFVGTTLQADPEDRPFDSRHGLWPWALPRLRSAFVPSEAKPSRGTRSGFRPTGVRRGATGYARGAPLAGSLACVAMAWAQRIQMVRVHDVKPTVQLLRMLEAIQGAHDASWR